MLLLLHLIRIEYHDKALIYHIYHIHHMYHIIRVLCPPKRANMIQANEITSYYLKLHQLFRIHNPCRHLCKVGITAPEP